MNPCEHCKEILKLEKEEGIDRAYYQMRDWGMDKEEEDLPHCCNKLFDELYRQGLRPFGSPMPKLEFNWPIAYNPFGWKP